ncbi:hypothetical protein ES703_43016 [subsurface metagenome]
MKFECITHHVALEITDKERKFTNPPGSYATMPKCQLHVMREPKEGKFQECEIRKAE